MKINDTFQYLNVGLPEDILRRKLHGDFTGAIRLIDKRLTQAQIPDELRWCLVAEQEMMQRMPTDYPLTRQEALSKIRSHIPDFSEEEFDCLPEALLHRQETLAC